MELDIKLNENESKKEWLFNNGGNTITGLQSVLTYNELKERDGGDILMVYRETNGPSILAVICSELDFKSHDVDDGFKKTYSYVKSDIIAEHFSEYKEYLSVIDGIDPDIIKWFIDKLIYTISLPMTYNVYYNMFNTYREKLLSGNIPSESEILYTLTSPCN